jgi:FkbM family methyltransferase
MTSPVDPLHRLIKLFRSLFQMRNLRRRAREHTPLNLYLRLNQKLLIKQTKKNWSGGYILTDKGDFVYVPKELDITALERLSREPVAEPIISKVCPPGGTVIDVGANMGDWALPMSKAVGANGKVYAFEPVPYLASALEKSFRINGLFNTVVSRKALSNKIGNENFTIPRQDSSSSNVRCSGLGVDIKNSYQSKVETSTLDAFCEKENFNKLDFIKIDVESHEAAVIQGGSETIKKFLPSIVFESGHWQETEEHRQNIRDVLEPLGYRIVGVLIEHGVIETDWNSYIKFEEPFQKSLFYNVLCQHTR